VDTFVVVVVGLLAERSGVGVGERVAVSGPSDVAGTVAVSGVRTLLIGVPVPVVAGVVVDKGVTVGIVLVSVPVAVDVVGVVLVSGRVVSDVGGVAEVMDVVVAVDRLVAVVVTSGVPVVEEGAVAETEMGEVTVVLALAAVEEATVGVAAAVGVVGIPIAAGGEPADARDGCTAALRNRTTNRTRLAGRSRTSMDRAFLP